MSYFPYRGRVGQAIAPTAGVPANGGGCPMPCPPAGDPSCPTGELAQWQYDQQRGMYFRGCMYLLGISQTGGDPAVAPGATISISAEPVIDLLECVLILGDNTHPNFLIASIKTGLCDVLAGGAVPGSLFKPDAVNLLQCLCFGELKAGTSVTITAVNTSGAPARFEGGFRGYKKPDATACR